MSTRKFDSQEALSDYLAWLSSELKAWRLWGLAEEVSHAGHLSGAGSPSEFHQVAYVALRKVKARCASLLTEAQMEDVKKVIQQIDDSFGQVGS